MKATARVGLALLAGACLTASATAGDGYDKRFEIARARNDGFFASLSTRWQAIKGDFRTGLTLWHFDKAFFIPSLGREEEYDYGLGIGRKTAYGSWEVRYSLALPRAAVDGRDETIQMHALEISGRSFLFPGRALQPYGLLGINIPLVFVKDGAAYLGKSLNALYAGIGLNAGAGLSWDFARDCFLDVGVVYRFQVFYYAYGEGKGRDINHLRTSRNGEKLGRLLRSSSLALTAGLSFLF